MDIEQEINSRQWFQKFPILGVWTPGVHDVVSLLKRIPLPEDLGGTVVLDAGANDGFFSFECERRGAEKVIALDHPDWGNAGHGKSSFSSFKLARELLDSEVSIDTCDLDEQVFGYGFWIDLVLALGLIYHIQNPILVLKKLKGELRPGSGKIILETHLDCLDHEEPLARFYPDSEICNDPTTYWGPNPACVLGWMNLAGFVNCKHERTYLSNPQVPASVRGIFTGEAP